MSFEKFFCKHLKVFCNLIKKKSGILSRHVKGVYFLSIIFAQITSYSKQMDNQENWASRLAAGNIGTYYFLKD